MAKSIWQKPTDDLFSLFTWSIPTNSAAFGYATSDLNNRNPAFGLHLSAATSFYLLGDLGGSVTKAVKFITFHNHNFAPGTVITVQGNATNSWGSPTVNSSVTVPAAAEDGFPVDFFWLNASQTTALRYWRIGTSATNAAAWILGQLWISDTLRYLPSDQPQPGIVVTRPRPIIEHLTPAPYGVSLRYPSPSRFTILTGEIKGPQADVEAVRDGWFSLGYGRARPTPFALIDTSGLECFLVIHDQDDMPAGQVKGQIWSAPVKLRTLSNGPGWS